MSDSDETPPPTKKRVQPRPRRVGRTPSGSNTSHSDVGNQSRRYCGSGSSDGLKSPLSSQSSHMGDEDDFFMRTKNFRELKSQVKANIPTEKDLEAAQPSPEKPGIEDSDVMPIFDFEDEAKRDKESEAAKETESNTTTKRKRELSITPPPELPKHIYDAILAKSKDGKRSHPILLGDDHRDTNRQTVIDVSDLDDKAQDTGLDPELASIAAKVSSASAGPGATDQVHQIHSLAEQQQPVDQPKEVSVLLRHLRYQWECTHLHPVELARVTMDVKIAMNDSDPFKGMMQFYAMHKMMRPSDLVFTYKNMRLLPSATPRSLSMPSVVVLDIYTEAGYNCMKQHADEERARWLLERSQQEEKTPPPKTGASDGHDSNANIGQTTLDQQDEGDEESEFLFIKIRGKDTTDERMRVKKSTTVAAICSAYKKLKRIAETTVVKLEFDDSTLPPQTSMADTDIEDDDMLTATLL